MGQWISFICLFGAITLVDKLAFISLIMAATSMCIACMARECGKDAFYYRELYLEFAKRWEAIL